jgi:hypothetical protein
MQKIAQKYGTQLDKVNEIYEQLIKEHGENANWQTVNTSEMDEYMKLIDETMENVRDDFVLSPKTAQRYYFDALRLRRKGKI